MEKLYTTGRAPNHRNKQAGPAPRRTSVRVPSFTTQGVEYDVVLEEGSCTCKRGVIHGDDHKHVRLARSGAPLGDATPGLLSDGTPVLFIEGVCHGYDKRVWGYDPGLWDHSLCHDGEAFIVESTRLIDGETRTRILHDWREWKRHIPFHGHAADPQP